MTSQSELNWRAALCRQLAKQEPANRGLWMAEAENWSRLSKEKLRREAAAKIVRRYRVDHGGPARRCAMQAKLVR